MRKRLLIIDDDASSRYITSEILSSDFDLVEASSKAQAIDLLQTQYFHLVTLDLLMPDVDDLELLETIKSTFPDLPVIMLTTEYDIDKAVEAMRLNADDYIVKETAPATLLPRVKRALEAVSSRFSSLAHQKESACRDQEIFIPDHPAYHEVFSRAKKAAEKGLNILIQGETGTGKDVLSRFIRRHVCPSAPIISLNCGAIPESLAEAELFGHEKNTFNEAPERKGKIELASGGILFLDEIGTMPLLLQQKLLRVLENRTVTRLGASKEIPVEFLQLSATNKPLENAVESGDFREDLYFRIRDVEITMPSLSDTPEVVDDFIDYFLDIFKKKYTSSFSLSSAQRDRLKTNLRGNIRGLKKEIQTMVALDEPGTSIAASDTQPMDLNRKLADMDAHFIRQALKQSDFNISKAATLLGLKRATLFDRMTKYHLHSSQ